MWRPRPLDERERVGHPTTGEHKRQRAKRAPGIGGSGTQDRQIRPLTLGFHA
ncbi:MAG TPA: hypothetical protein VGF67_10090 [Ktedonobacteraceae bacterium]